MSRTALDFFTFTEKNLCWKTSFFVQLRCSWNVYLKSNTLFTCFCKFALETIGLLKKVPIVRLDKTSCIQSSILLRSSLTSFADILIHSDSEKRQNLSAKKIDMQKWGIWESLYINQKFKWINWFSSFIFYFELLVIMVFKYTLIFIKKHTIHNDQTKWLYEKTTYI